MVVRCRRQRIMEKSLHTPGYRRFCELLRQVREERGLTQIDLADRLGEGQDFVSKCERGVRRLDVVELRQWCHALGTPFTDFMHLLDAELPSLPKRRRR